MAKKMTKAENQLFGWLIVIGLPVYGITQPGEAIGWETIVTMTAVAVFLYLLFKFLLKKKRRNALMAKYDDAELVGMIMSGSIWQGQTAEQLLDARGKAHDIDQKILKTKKKDVWKYSHQGANRYGLRMTPDDDLVTGWDNRT